jgi:hypothetical protein
MARLPINGSFDREYIELAEARAGSDGFQSTSMAVTHRQNLGNDQNK